MRASRTSLPAATLAPTAVRRATPPRLLSEKVASRDKARSVARSSARMPLARPLARPPPSTPPQPPRMSDKMSTSSYWCPKPAPRRAMRRRGCRRLNAGTPRDRSRRTLSAMAPGARSPRVRTNVTAHARRPRPRRPGLGGRPRRRPRRRRRFPETRRRRRCPLRRQTLGGSKRQMQSRGHGWPRASLSQVRGRQLGRRRPKGRRCRHGRRPMRTAPASRASMASRASCTGSSTGGARWSTSGPRRRRAASSCREGAWHALAPRVPEPLSVAATAHPLTLSSYICLRSPMPPPSALPRLLRPLSATLTAASASSNAVPPTRLVLG